jgi:hypothetical protein
MAKIHWGKQMADFCQQCSLAIFGEDFGDLKTGKDLPPAPPIQGWDAICEGCGPTIVDANGKCIGDCLEHHSQDKL